MAVAAAETSMAGPHCGPWTFAPAAKWKHEHKQGRGAMGGGILTTAGHLLFTGDSGEFVAFDPANGKLLWHQRITQPVSNGPSTWVLDASNI